MSALLVATCGGSSPAVESGSRLSSTDGGNASRAKPLKESSIETTESQSAEAQPSELRAELDAVIACPREPGGYDTPFRCPAFVAFVGARAEPMSAGDERWLLEVVSTENGISRESSVRRYSAIRRLQGQKGPRNTDAVAAVAFLEAHHFPRGLFTDNGDRALGEVVGALPIELPAVSEALVRYAQEAPEKIAYDVVQGVAGAHRGAAMGVLERFVLGEREDLRASALHAMHYVGLVTARACELASPYLHSSNGEVFRSAALVVLRAEGCEPQRGTVLKRIEAILADNPRAGGRYLLERACSTPALRQEVLRIARLQLQRAREISDYHDPLDAVIACQPKKSPEAAVAPWTRKGGDAARAARRAVNRAHDRDSR